jgi:imidazolonepropionase-like amidohydrolase
MEFLFKGAQFLDTKTGELQVEEIAVSDGHFVEKSTLKEPTIVDATGLTAMFGLWDCHSHPGSLMYDPQNEGYFENPARRTIRAGENMIDALRYGVTGTRTVSEANEIDLEWGRAFKDGIFHGPIVKSGGPGLRVTGGHGTTYPKVALQLEWEWAADGPDEMRKATRRLIEMGVDWIKLMLTGGLYSEHETVEDSQFTFEEIDAVLEIAHNKSIPVAAHCGGARIAEYFANKGGKSIEHGYALDERAAAAMAKNGTWFVPTIGVTHDFEMMERDGWPDHAKNRAQEASKRHAESLKACIEAGVRIATGADLNPIGPRLHAEIRMLERAGMDRLSVLRAASVGGRELNGLGAHSKISLGQSADLIFLEGNPLELKEGLDSPRMVLTNKKLAIFRP